MVRTMKYLTGVMLQLEETFHIKHTGAQLKV